MQINKPKGRLAKRMAFYALNRRKAQGRSFLRQLRAALPAKAEHQPVAPLSTVYQGEWEAPTFEAFRAGSRICTESDMSIYVRNATGGGLELVAGYVRLRAMLDVQGKAWVRNTSTDEQLEVHEVGGQLLALTPDAVAAVQSVAATSICHAAKR
ncbi:hypothetical protein LJR118_006713 [Acidovorax sp. LjRoot118]|uniref:hypothetical protein n=1 Tax=Acidovorax sp. LjRoot118 TaxID=3342256 RepID=UPI003ED08AE8